MVHLGYANHRHPSSFCYERHIMQEVNGITIYRDWVEVANTLKSDAERGQFYHSIALYSIYRIEPQLTGLQKIFFDLIRPQIDKSQKSRIAQQKGAQNRKIRKYQELQSEPPPQPARKKGNTYAFMLPEQLRSDRCVEKWNQWEEYRRQKHKPISTAAVYQFIENARNWDEETFINAVDFSIANDYQALVPSKNRTNTTQIKQKDNTGI